MEYLHSNSLTIKKCWSEFVDSSLVFTNPILIPWEANSKSEQNIKIASVALTMFVTHIAAKALGGTVIAHLAILAIGSIAHKIATYILHKHTLSSAERERREHTQLNREDYTNMYNKGIRDFRWYDFNNTNFAFLNLFDSNFEGANLSNTTLEGANLGETNLKDAIITSNQMQSLRRRAYFGTPTISPRSV